MIIDNKRLERQKLVIQRWIKSNYIGIVKAVTGTGKTYIGILAIQYIISRRPEANIVIIVPTLYLQNQWKEILHSFKLDKVKVLVINTASKTELSCDLLIVDELHTSAAEYWINIFDTIKYKAFLGLTATLERNDGRHKLILQKAPIIDEINLEEALREGYIANYKIYNLPIELTNEEIKEFKKTQSSYTYYEHLLGGKFSAWDNANTWLKTGDDEQKKQALMFLRAVNKRKQMLYNASNKIAVTKQILDRYSDRKGIIFCESIDFATKVDKLLDNKSVLYHSGLKLPEKRAAIQRFIDNRTAAKIMVSVKALDAGVDVPDVTLGIACAGTSTELQTIQRLGRSIRKNLTNTIAIFFNLYVADTQEEKWIRSKCYNLTNVYWINNLDEI